MTSAPGRGAAMPPIRVPVGTWVDGVSGAVRSDMPATLARRGVVLLGEKHDEAEHHRWQLHTIAGLFAAQPGMMLGFEMFPRRAQNALDRWVDGDLNEADFLATVDWPQVWGFDPALYLPLFHFARMHRVPMLALNVERATNRLVAARGLDGVAIIDREGVGDPAPAAVSYRERLFDIFAMHPGMGQGASPESAAFERFVRAQIFWDRAMAQAITEARRRTPSTLVVGIMGRGHVEYGDGVPHQLAALGIADVATALPWDSDTDCSAGIADVLFGIAPRW